MAGSSNSSQLNDDSSVISQSVEKHSASLTSGKEKNKFLVKCTELVGLIEAGMDMFRTVDNRFPL